MRKYKKENEMLCKIIQMFTDMEHQRNFFSIKFGSCVAKYIAGDLFECKKDNEKDCVDCAKWAECIKESVKKLST